MDVTGIHHVALSVRDRDASAAWYADVFGFMVLFQEEADDRRACVMRFPGGGYSVGLVEHLPSADGSFDPMVRGLDHVAFTVQSREELDEWAARLGENGIEHSGPVDIPAGAILNLKDPDGISLALFWDGS